MTLPSPVTATSYRPGTIVEARRRLWRVDRQQQDELVVTAIDGGLSEQRRLYLGLDPDGRPFERITAAHLSPPDAQRVGAPAAQDMLLRAYRLSLLHGSAPLLSLQRSRVIPTNYQLVPVVMALAEPRVRLALFDDVGLGKTIEAGLIITELMARQMASRVLVICPANLREQWREALSYFFHLDDARIISDRHRREMARQLPQDADPWAFYRCLIVSEDYAKQVHIRQEILAQPWDIVLIDEAHTLAKPHQSAPDQSVDMERWRLAQALGAAPSVRHLLLLTATPHNGFSDSFASLLRLLDVGAVEGPDHDPIIHQEVARRHVCQRTRNDLATWFAREGRANPFPKRDQHPRVIYLSAAETAAIDAAEAYGQLVLRDAQDTPRQVMAYWAVMHLHKRALSSPHALRISLRNRRDALTRRLDALRTAADASGAPDAVDDALRVAQVDHEADALSQDAARANALDADPGERLTEEEAGVRVERGLYANARQNAGRLRAQIEVELRELEGALALAEKITVAQDSKLRHVMQNELPELLRRSPRVIIFTRYRDTMTYVADQIEQSGRYRDTTVIRIEGQMSERQRQEAFMAFGAAPRALLVATDAISEGVNLQEHCCQMIHWELPWNPNRLEQRVGRVDRFGQPEPEVRVRLLVMNDTLDGLILKVLVQKALQIREDYGFAPPFFGDDRSVIDLLREQGLRVSLRPQQLTLFDETPPGALGAGAALAENPFADETLARIKAESYYGATNVSVPDIERRLRATNATIGSPEAIQTFVRSALQAFDCVITDQPDHTFRVALTREDLRVEGVPDVIARATFDPQAALDDPGQTLLDLGHPLVRRLLDVVRDSAFHGRNAPYGRAAALATADVRETTTALHILARFVVGTTPSSIVEELIPLAFPLYSADRAALPLERVHALLQARPASRTLTEDTIREDLAEALGRADLDALIAEAIEQRRTALVADRRQLLAQANASGDAQGAAQAAWLRGADDLALASHDMLTVTIYYPALG